MQFLLAIQTNIYSSDKNESWKALQEAINAGNSFSNKLESKMQIHLYFVLIHFMNVTGNENEFKRLVLDGANLNALNATDENGNSALILATLQGIH